MNNRIPESFLKFLYKSLTVAFGVTGTAFFVFPDGTIDVLNASGRLLGLPDAPHLAHRFWLGLGVAYMAVVTVLAAQIAAAPTARRLLMIPLATGKLVSSLTCLGYFLFDQFYFIYLANFLIDGFLAALVFWTWRQTDPLARDGSQSESTASELDPPSMAILRSIADTFMPAGGAFPASANDIDLAGRVAEHICRIGPAASLGFRILLRWVDLQPILRLRFRRFHKLQLVDRVQVLESMELSRLMIRRQPAIALKTLMGLHGYNDPAVHEHLGYERKWIEDRIKAAQERRNDGRKGPYPGPESPVLADTVF